MHVAAELPSLDHQQHIVLDDVSWELYEHLLDELSERHLRLTYSDRRLEIMSPLPRHEVWAWRIGRLLDLMCLELSIQIVGLRSTTFRHAAKRKGLEPDACYYIQHAAEARQMEEAFDPQVNPPPDLAIEIDITRRSVAREPIYAALGVPELWRLDKNGLHVLALSPDREYQPTANSIAFPFLPLSEFERFVHRLADEDGLTVLRAFQQWVRTLKP